MDILCIFLGVVFLIFGLLFALGRLHIHLPGWRNMPEREKQKINAKALVCNIGVVIMLCGGIFLAKGLIAAFTARRFTAAMVAWMVAAGLDLWHISKSSRYFRK